MSIVRSQLSVLMIWREKRGHIFWYDDQGTGAPAQGLNPNPKSQDSGDLPLPSGSTDLTVNLHFYSKLTNAH